MDLSTTYLGLELPHPFMPGASPLADDMDMVRRLEDAGAAAIVMRSLFEEQIRGEQLAAHRSMDIDRGIDRGGALLLAGSREISSSAPTSTWTSSGESGRPSTSP